MRKILPRYHDHHDRPVFYATVSGDEVKLSTLLMSGADVNERDIEGVSALHIAVVSKNYSLVKLLLTYGADPNQATDSGVTALMWAANMGDEKILMELIAMGANVNVADRQALGSTALIWALSDGKCAAGVVKCLLAAGADPNVLDPYGRTPFHLAKATGDKNVIDLLLAHGAI